MTVLGIDPGSKGGLAIDDNLKLVAGLPIPYLDPPQTTVRVARPLDSDRLKVWLRDKTIDLIVIEWPPNSYARRDKKGNKIRTGTSDMLLHEYAAKIEQALMLLLPDVPLARVAPPTWKAWMLRGMPRYDDAGKKLTDKARAREAAYLLWGEWVDDHMIMPRCTVPHDGIVDAALIARYGAYFLGKFP